MKLGGGMRFAEERLIVVWEGKRRIPRDNSVCSFVVKTFGKSICVIGNRT